jgi:anti-anti-sigma regulatory factor
MLRITTEESEESTELKLEGKLAGVWVDELEQTWHAFAQRKPDEGILVDLCGVTFIDAQGKLLLKRMHGHGARFRCCGPDITATVREIESDVIK